MMQTLTPSRADVLLAKEERISRLYPKLFRTKLTGFALTKAAINNLQHPLASLVTASLRRNYGFNASN